jgi:hypothetical protein
MSAMGQELTLLDPGVGCPTSIVGRTRPLAFIAHSSFLDQDFLKHDRFVVFGVPCSKEERHRFFARP